MHPLSILKYAIVLGALVAMVLGALVYHRFRNRRRERR
jgi:hypothetical protein